MNLADQMRGSQRCWRVAWQFARYVRRNIQGPQGEPQTGLKWTHVFSYKKRNIPWKDLNCSFGLKGLRVSVAVSQS